MSIVCASLLGAVAIAAAPVVALHDGTVLPAAIQWETTVVHDAPVAGGGRVRVELAVPLPPETEAGFGDTTLVRDGSGAVTALEAEPVAVVAMPRPGQGAVVVYRVRQPLAAGAAREGTIRLAAPLLAGSGVSQGVALNGESGARFTPDARLGIEHRLGRLATPGLGHDALRRLENVERGLGRSPAPWRCWLEVDAALLEAGGLVGTLETGRPRSSVVVAAALGFVGAVALLGLGIRGMARVARRDRDDALLDRELRELRRGQARAE